MISCAGLLHPHDVSTDPVDASAGCESDILIDVGADDLVQTFPADAAAVGSARRRVAAYARLHGIADVDGVALAVSEVITNVVLHAYVGAPAPGLVYVTAALVDGEGLVVWVGDDGRGMTPRSDSPGIGVGLPLVATLAHHL